MKRFYDGFTTVNNALKKVELYLGAICLGALFIIMIVNAALRYLFMGGLDFSDEINGFLFVWMGFLGAALVMANKGHLCVTAFIELFPATVRYIVNLILNIIMLVMIILYMKPLSKLLVTLPISNVMRIPLQYVYIILPISFALMGIHIIYNMLDDTMAFLEDRAKGKEVEA